MPDLEQRVLAAQRHTDEKERLLADYLPLLKKQVARFQHRDVEYDDMLSIAMLVFLQSIERYTPGRGSFLAYVETNVRNRIIDEIRKSNRRTVQFVPLSEQTEADSSSSSHETTASLEQYSLEAERQSMAEEIEALNGELQKYDISFSLLAKISPRQRRAQEQCRQLAYAVLQNPELKTTFEKSGRLPQTALAQKFGISAKTVEKHRRYIVALCVILLGDFPQVRAFVTPGERQVS